MRIPPGFLDAVAFLCERRNRDGRTENIPTGTAFFVAVPDQGTALADTRDDEWTSGKTWNYVVTARHCIEETTHQTIYVRINTAHKFIDLPTSKDDWFVHDSADVAAILLPTETLPVVFEPVPFHTFITRDYKLVPSKGTYGDGIVAYVGRAYPDGGIPIQLGDDLFFAGLFVRSAGTQRNLPIARFGNISRMPSDELITLETKARGNVQIRAYLAECHSWGGHSGSPVFWYFDYIAHQPRPVFMVAFLGLVSAHFDIEMETLGAKKTLGGDGRLITKLNSGMAVITPAENIRELLMRPDLIEDRNKRRAIADRKGQLTATLDRASGAKTQETGQGETIPVPSRGQFERDLDKATRRKKPS